MQLGLFQAPPSKPSTARFYLGTHMPHWLADPAFRDVPLFVSRRRLIGRQKKVRPAVGSWALDSGGFTELNLHGTWSISTRQYVEEIRRFRSEIGGLEWAAPQDWMCEPFVLARTGLTLEEHQRRTVANLVELRDLAPELPIVPVLQGWTAEDYLRCRDLYAAAGVDLTREPVVGLGTICRRQGTLEAERVVRRLAAEGLRLHAFGAKVTGLVRYADAVASSDSMAWSFNARKHPPLEGHRHANCSSCPTWALRWRTRLIDRLS